MNKHENSIKLECEKYMYRNNLNTNYELSIVLYNPKITEDVYGYIINLENPYEILSIKPYDNNVPQSIAEWDYNIDSYELESLQNGYEIAYLSMNAHYNYWSAIEQWLPEEIENKEGLQKYLKYCKHQGITKEVIEKCVDLPLETDIMNFYVETNQGYIVVAECNINGRCIVLAENKNATSPYVTWNTVPDRKNGYTNGHYLNSIGEAQQDYFIRAKNELQYSIREQLTSFTKHKEKEVIR